MSSTGTTTNNAEQPVTGSSPTTQPPNSAGQPAIPIFEVAFRNGMWWSIPAEMSTTLYEKYTNNEDANYTWGWAMNEVALGNQRERRQVPIAIKLTSLHGSNET